MMVIMMRVASLFRTTIILIGIWSAGTPAFGQSPEPGQAPPPAVIVEQIEVQEVDDPSEFIARVEAIESVDIRARVEGFLHTVGFEAGAIVSIGDLLFEIEPDQYAARVASARAQLSRAEAERHAAERTLARTRELLEREVAAEASFDEAQAAFDVAHANVEAARAALRNAELDLSYTRITAPIAGQIGRAQYTQGNLVGPEAGPLARIVRLDPIRVAFSIPEAQLVSLRQQISNGGAVDTAALRLTLRLPNGTEYEQLGQFEYVESEVNPQTGTVAVRVVFPNPARLLIPFQSVTMVVREEDVLALPVVPQSAVLQDRQGRFVYVLTENNTVTRRRIETASRVKNGWAVTQGLSGGESVVVQGIQRLQEGITVQPSEGQPIDGGS